MIEKTKEMEKEESGNIFGCVGFMLSCLITLYVLFNLGNIWMLLDKGLNYLLSL